MSTEDLRCSILNPHPLTVGEKFKIDCDATPGLSGGDIAAKFVLDDEFLLQVVSVAMTDHPQLTVLSDRVGQQKIESAVLELRTGQDIKTYRLPELAFTVQSSQNQNEPQAEPFNPYGPLRFGPPWGFFAVILFGIVVIIGIGIWLRRLRKKKLAYLARLDQAAGAGVDPLNQLYKNLRSVDLDLRKMDTTAAHEKMRDVFRLFLERNFQLVLEPTRATQFFRRAGLARSYWIWERLETEALSLGQIQELREILLREAETFRKVGPT